jgi:hypothetical protein
MRAGVPLTVCTVTVGADQVRLLLLTLMRKKGVPLKKMKYIPSDKQRK